LRDLLISFGLLGLEASADVIGDIDVGNINEVTMPSPTRAMIVSSVAPPTKRSRFVRTVTRARTLTPMPSFATAVIFVTPALGFGQSMTFGLMEVRTASRTVFPVSLVARSMAQARSKVRAMPAFSAATSARTTLMMSPPAR